MVTDDPSAWAANIVHDLALAVDQHRTGAALAGIAADVCASEIELFAEEMDEEQPRLHLGPMHGAVDSDRDLDRWALE